MTELLKKDKQYIWHPYSSLKSDLPMDVVKSAKGVWIELEDGRKKIDAISSWWVNNFGHGNEQIAKAIYEQALNLEHVIFAGHTHEPAILLAERLLPKIPGDMQKIFYCDNGSTAVEVALKLSLQYFKNSRQKKHKIIAFEGAFHGDTFGAMALSERGIFTEAFDDLLFDVKFIPLPNSENIETILSDLNEFTKSNQVCSFIYEPLVQGAAGMRIYDSFFMNQILQFLKTKEVILIADEVFTGFGRTGTLFASEQIETVPDIVCLSKGITGGFMPFGAVAISNKIAQAFDSPESTKTFYHGHSYTGNPLACAAALKVLDLFEEKTTWENIENIVKFNHNFTKDHKNNTIFKNCTFKGTILRFELENSDGNNYLAPIREIVFNYFKNDPVLIRPLGNVIYTLPPYIINQAELSTIDNSLRSFYEYIKN